MESVEPEATGGRATTVAGRSATAVLEVGDEEPDNVTKTVHKPWHSHA